MATGVLIGWQEVFHRIARYLNLSAPAFEHAVQRDVPESSVPLGELPGAENAPAVRSTDDLLRYLLTQGAAGGGVPGAPDAPPNPSPAGGPSGMLHQDCAPAPPPMPGPRFRHPTGYRIPVLPQREKPMQSVAALLGIPTSPEAERKALYDRLLKAAVAEREAASRRVAEVKEEAPCAPDVERPRPMKNAMRTAQVERVAAGETIDPDDRRQLGVAETTAAVFDAGPPTDQPVGVFDMYRKLGFDPGGPGRWNVGPRNILYAHIYLGAKIDAYEATARHFSGSEKPS